MWVKDTAASDVQSYDRALDIMKLGAECGWMPATHFARYQVKHDSQTSHV